jgi:hypothetical protein
MLARYDWAPFCAAANLLRDYARGRAIAPREILSAIVLVESTIEALEVERLVAIERVALECGRRMADGAWRRREDELGLCLATSPPTEPNEST